MALIRSGTLRRFLVTGGAGYVGSHVVAALRRRGEEVVVLDDLSQGHRGAVAPGARLVVAGLGDRSALDPILAEGPWYPVMHFASLSLVGESMAQPLRYMLENAGTGLSLIDACIRHGVRRFVLSSTANLFGSAGDRAITEDMPVEPQSPYGESKYLIERALHWADEAHGLRSARLRYFNAAGADPDGLLGEDHDPETHLIPLVIDAALGRRPELVVFGTDYPTPDGTCVRDYVHVADLAEAHLAVLDRLDRCSVTYNVGNGAGHSVREVIAAVERVTGRAVPLRHGPRRGGDPARLVASTALIRQDTGWRPQFSDLHEIVRTAYAWRLAHPCGYADRDDPVRVAAVSSGD